MAKKQLSLPIAHTLTSIPTGEDIKTHKAKSIVSVTFFKYKSYLAATYNVICHVKRKNFPADLEY